MLDAECFEVGRYEARLSEFCSYWNNDKNKYAYINVCFLFLIRWQDERSSALAIQAFEELFPINMHHPNLAVAML